MVEPNAEQHRAAAFILGLIAALTAVAMAVVWLESVHGPLLLPILVAYFVFNGGYVFAVIKGQLQTRGAKIGLNAVGLNFVAMLLSDFETLWTIFSAASIATAIWGALVLFSEAKRAAA